MWMRSAVVIGWMVAFAAALGIAVVTRRGTAWVGLGLLALPAIFVVLAVRYGTH